MGNGLPETTYELDGLMKLRVGPPESCSDMPNSE